LIATWWTAKAVCNLIKKLNWEVIECSFIINLPELGWMNKLEKQWYNSFSLIDFEGE
jgi:adenine phosphoribosyltransferase